MKSYFTLISFLLLTSISFSQQQINSTFQGKHHMLSKDELSATIKSSRVLKNTSKPANARSIAEWESNEAVIISYVDGQGFGIPTALIAELSHTVKVITLCYSKSIAELLLRSMVSYGVDTSQMEIVIGDVDSYWTRDYSPWYIAVDSEVAICDFPYNRPSRPNDDDVPILMGREYDMDVYGMNVIQTGGNYMTDGMGVAASTELVVEENNTSKSDINQQMSDYLGIKKYHILPDPQGEYIKHIDCWGKFLDVDKILIGQVNSSNLQYDEYEAAARYWETQTSSYGTPYQIHRVYSPNGQPYTNSLIINNKVFVPIVSDLGEEWNDDAIATYQKAMPGYEIIAFNEKRKTPWEPTDALHCRTHEVADRDMLYIKHIPIEGNQDQYDSYTIETQVMSYAGHTISKVELHYQIDSSEYQSSAMTLKENNTYSCNIPTIEEGSSFNYYIESQDSTGRVAMHPRMGDRDPHHFKVDSRASLSRIINSPNITTFPNPVSTQLYINFKGGYTQNYNVSICNLNGLEVFNTRMNINGSNDIKTVDVSNFAKGVYLVKISSSSEQYVQKVMVR